MRATRVLLIMVFASGAVQAEIVGAAKGAGASTSAAAVMIQRAPAKPAAISAAPMVPRPALPPAALPAARAPMKPVPRETRVYRLDADAGRIRFGDGVQGRVPPSGSGDLTATYRHGGGATAPASGDVSMPGGKPGRAPARPGPGLLPHEATHTVQQRPGVIPDNPQPGGGLVLTPLDDPRLHRPAPGGDGDATMTQMDLQNAMQNQQRTMQILSNISKNAHDTQQAVIENMK